MIKLLIYGVLVLLCIYYFVDVCLLMMNIQRERLLGKYIFNLFRQTIHDPVPYPNSLWKKISIEAKTLVDSKKFI